MVHLAIRAALPLLLTGGAALACPLSTSAAHAPTVLADNAATSTAVPANTGKAPDTTAYPNSPNGSPAAGDKGQPVVTDKAACTGAGATATCPDSPAPSGKADTSDTKSTTPTTVDGTAKP